jgi:hypothetical protein
MTSPRKRKAKPAVEQTTANTESTTAEKMPAEEGDAGDAIQIQSAMQSENASFTAVSNVLKTRHDTAKNSISNVR